MVILYAPSKDIIFNTIKTKKSKINAKFIINKIRRDFLLIIFNFNIERQKNQILINKIVILIPNIALLLNKIICLSLI